MLWCLVLVASKPDGEGEQEEEEKILEEREGGLCRAEGGQRPAPGVPVHTSPSHGGGGSRFSRASLSDDLRAVPPGLFQVRGTCGTQRAALGSGSAFLLLENGGVGGRPCGARIFSETTRVLLYGIP